MSNASKRFPRTSRRGILAKAATLGAVAVAARSALVDHAEAQGEQVKVGGLYYTAESPTEIAGSFNGHILGIGNASPAGKIAGIVAVLGSEFPDLSPAAIWGHSTHASGDGVVGTSGAVGKSGVYGRNLSGDGFGVSGISNGRAGVYGENSGNGFGVQAVSKGPSAVRAFNSGDGLAVSAQSGSVGATIDSFNSGPGTAIKGTAGGVVPTVVGLALGDGVGVFGAAKKDAAIWGRNDGTGDGVKGHAIDAVAAGVRGANSAGDGVAGSSAASGGVGIRGTGGPGGTGVRGEATAGGNGVAGVARQSGIGVSAAGADGATALEVIGLNRFTQVGRGSFEAGKRQAVIPNVLATATSGILVTLNGAAGPGIYLQHARINPNTKRAVLQLNRAAKRAVRFTYFIVDEVVV